MNKATFSAQLDALPQMLAWICNALSSSHVEIGSLYKIELAVEEILVNVIHYAYGPKSGLIEMSLKVEPRSHIEIGIRDWGVPFNPCLQGPNVNVNASMEERKEGGLGIFLAHQLLDDILYEWDGTSNLLILIKHFSQKP